MKAISDLGLYLSDYLLILLLIVCIVTDIKSRRVYNKVLVPFLIASLVVNFVTGGGQLLLESVKGFFIGLALLIIPFARGGIGAGDVKLLAVIGAIKGSVFVIYVFLAGALAGGLFALFFLAANGQLRATLSKLLQTLYSLIARYGVVIRASHGIDQARTVYFPYTLAIGAGVIAVYAARLESLVRW